MKNIKADGYHFYPLNKNIYKKGKEEARINPENISKLKVPNKIEKKLRVS